MKQEPKTATDTPEQSNRDDRRQPAGPPLTPFGNDGLDTILGGGLPAGRVMLAVGDAGCGKTVFGMQFLMSGVLDHDAPGVLVSFEETPEDIIANAAGFGWDMRSLITARKLAISFMDLHPADAVESGPFDLTGLFLRVELLVKRVGAKRIVIDGINNLLAAFEDEDLVRMELLRLFRWLKDHHLTVFATGERGKQGWTRLGFEEYLADGLMVLDNRIEGKLSKRSLRVVKCRGIGHGSNEYAFLITAQGPKVFPIDAIGLDYKVIDERISTGIAGLDNMLGGAGVYRGSTVLIGGTAGTGKTTLAASFLDEACRRGEKALLFTLEEAPDQIRRNMASVGIDLAAREQQGLLRIMPLRTLRNEAEGHLTEIQDAVSAFGARVIAIDPVSTLNSIANDFEIRGLLARLVDFLRSHDITTVMTNLGSEANGEVTGSLTISSIADTWIVARQIEHNIERNTVIQVIKARGMAHSKDLREFTFTPTGIQILEPFIHPDGVVIGSARVAAEARTEAQRIIEEAGIDKRFREIERRRRALDAEIEALNAKHDAERAAVETEWAAYQKKYEVETAAIERMRLARAGTRAGE